MARAALEALPCPVELDQRDFVAAMAERPKPADVAWIGLSLHHLFTPAKLTLMREIRGAPATRGSSWSTSRRGPTARIATPTWPGSRA